MKQKLRKITIAICLLFSIVLNAQQSYYYYKGEKKNLIVDRKYVNLFVDASFTNTSLANLGLKNFTLAPTNLKTNEKYGKLEFETEPSEMEYLQKVNALKNTVGITGVAKYYRSSATKSVGTSNLFYIKLKTLSDSIKLKEVAMQKNVVVHHQNKFMPLWFALYRNKSTLESAVELTNLFYETGYFDAIDPAFMLNYTINPEIENIVTTEVANTDVNACSNDPLYNQQWGLGVVRACSAWNISQGLGVKVAVVDTGIQLNHSDLAANIFSLSYNTQTNASPSVTNSVLSPNHGTHVAGIIGAVRNNSFQIAGVAPKVQLISISNPLDYFDEATYPAFSEQLANGISIAYQNGAEVINNSWGVNHDLLFGTYSYILENAIANAINLGRNGKGCVVIFATGNEDSPIRYPGNSNPDILTVGASSSNYSRWGWSNTGVELDIMAPGTNIISTVLNNGSQVISGTSMAAPHVAGIASLVIATNPCLTGLQVRNIIEATARKNIDPRNNPSTYNYAITAGRPNGTWNEEMGYGIADALGAVQMAQQIPQGSANDLYIKDNSTDQGTEPNTTTQISWDSPDIWLRRNPDGIEVHENANGNTNYIYVRVRNKSCFDFVPEPRDVVILYQTYPVWGNGGPGYSEVNRAQIPAIPAGGNVILRFSINVTGDFGHWMATSGAACFLAEINALNDPTIFTNPPFGIMSIDYTINNNNVAKKRGYVVRTGSPPNSDDSGRSQNLVLGNQGASAASYTIELVKEQFEVGKPIYVEAEVGVKMDDNFYTAWSRGGKVETNLKDTANERLKLVENNHVLVDNVSFTANEFGSLNFAFNFLTDELTPKSNYKYHIIQRDKATNKIVNGATFEIQKQPRPVFNAVAGADLFIDKNEPITLAANQISEAAVYNWYDTEGNLLYQGKDFSIAPEIAKKYKLEVIAAADGFKDYDEVEVKLKPSIIAALSPNPANEQLTVNYKVNSGDSAYLIVLGSYGTTNALNNYVLNINQKQISINTSAYIAGLYTVALVCNGQIVDTKTLIKN